jgi:sirohydrochlorin ferrochelatase
MSIRTVFHRASLCLLALVIVATATGRNVSALRESQTPRRGVLLLAHGGKPAWNQAVLDLAGKVDRTFPTEVAFGMATRSAIQLAVDKLTARNVSEIVAVPLFVSSHSSVITSTEYLLGLRPEAPPELARFARMSHGGATDSGHAAHGRGETAIESGTTPVTSALPIVMTEALNQHPIVAEVVTSRATALSSDASRESIILVAHGPVTDRENEKWLADLASVAGRVSAATSFADVKYLTVRDDAPEPIRSRATAELREMVSGLTAAGRRVLIVPVLLSYGGIEDGIRKRLEGLQYTMSPQALMPDDRLETWVLNSARRATLPSR